MKTLIIALNAKYTHTALSVWYLKANCHTTNCEVMEFTINEPLQSIFCAIVPKNPDMVAFSCYIWNIEQILKLCEMIKIALPNAKILLGGPEVSYYAKELMEQYPFIDYILLGEGEQSFASLLKGDETAMGVVLRRHLKPSLVRKRRLHSHRQFPNKKMIGLTADVIYRKNDQIYQNGGYQMIADLNSICSPYTKEMLAATKGRTMYFEASRGCPFSCSYCLSSTFDGVRYFSLDRVKAELAKLCDAGVKQIKFVDRTFNCNKKRAMEIIAFIIQETGDTHFHFEIAADLLDDEIINLLAKAQTGKIQLEIGVQTVNETVLEAVNRKTDSKKVLSNVEKLQNAGNIHIHLDLIAGLPYEDLQSFKHSFDEVYKAKPHQLQLGFLKLLKGSEIRESANHGYQYASFPPYEIIANLYINAEELISLKKIEDVLDRYYNSGRFTKTLEFLAKEPFAFYNKLASFVDFKSPPSLDQLYQVLMDFVDAPAGSPVGSPMDAFLISDLLKLDFLSSTRFGKFPTCISRRIEPDFREKCFAYLKETEKTMPAKEKYKTVHFESFDFDLTNPSYEKKETILLFDYTATNPVTGRYPYQKISL